MKEDVEKSIPMKEEVVLLFNHRYLGFMYSRAFSLIVLQMIMLSSILTWHKIGYHVRWQTIVWVELTKEQRAFYRAIYENNISTLLKGSIATNMPSLRNVVRHHIRLKDETYYVSTPNS